MSDITVTDLAALLPESPVILDIREDDEYAAVHVPGVLHIPMSELLQRLPEVPTDAPVYVICAVGGRSAQVAAYLDSTGLEAVNVFGGTVAWEQAGFAVEHGAAS